jgi:hypothetical protein
LLSIDYPNGSTLVLFTSALIGTFQAIIHTIGNLCEYNTAHGLGAGYYLPIPLSLVGVA